METFYLALRYTTVTSFWLLLVWHFKVFFKFVIISPILDHFIDQIFSTSQDVYQKQRRENKLTGTVRVEWCDLGNASLNPVSVHDLLAGWNSSMISDGWEPPPPPTAKIFSLMTNKLVPNLSDCVMSASLHSRVSKSKIDDVFLNKKFSDPTMRAASLFIKTQPE